MNPAPRPRANEEREKIDLFFSCRKIDLSQSKFHKQHLISFKRLLIGQNWMPVGRTEISINNANPDFATSFELEFVFETKQTYKAELLNIEHASDDSGIVIGEVIFDIGEILGSLNNLRIYDLVDSVGNSGGKIIIRADKHDKTNKKLLSFGAEVVRVPKFHMFSSHNSFLKFYKLRSKPGLQKSDFDAHSDSQGGEWLLVHSTPNKTGENANFGTFAFQSSKLSGGSLDQPFKIELWKHKDNGAHYLLGSLLVRISDFAVHNRFQFNLLHDQNAGTNIVINNYRLEDTYDFTDYLRGNLSIGLIAGIDFTGSNCPCNEPFSLHYLKNGSLNFYQQALLLVGEILEYYNHTRVIPAFGFGAEMPGEDSVNHCFPLSLDINRVGFGNFGELFTAYDSTLQRIVFSGPTYFAPLIKTGIEMTRQRYSADPYNYTVLLILTDGLINDLQETMDQIVEASFWPMSIIIIGVGDANFSSMDVLDGDINPLHDSNGRKTNRDIVQFVPFKQFINQPFMLRQEVLAELPNQVVKFYQLNKIKPRQAQKLSLSDVSLSNLAMINKNQGGQTGHNYPTLEEIIAKSKI